jgi:Ni/Co efflux regulator RcnB
VRPVIVVIFAVLVAAAPLCASAQTSGNATSATQKERDAQRARALARCKADRGVDCDTSQGLNEWVLQERSRAQARREGSRRGSPVPEPVQPRK